jgi:hypothetical protein
LALRCIWSGSVKPKAFHGRRVTGADRKSNTRFGDGQPQEPLLEFREKISALSASPWRFRKMKAFNRQSVNRSSHRPWRGGKDHHRLPILSAVACGRAFAKNQRPRNYGKGGLHSSAARGGGSELRVCISEAEITSGQTPRTRRSFRRRSFSERKRSFSTNAAARRSPLSSDFILSEMGSRKLKDCHAEGFAFFGLLCDMAI